MFYLTHTFIWPLFRCVYWHTEHHGYIQNSLCFESGGSRVHISAGRQGLPCMISGFLREVDNNCVLLGCYSASSGNFLPTFREKLTSPFFTPEHGTDRFCRNVGKNFAITRYVKTQKSAVLTRSINSRFSGIFFCFVKWNFCICVLGWQLIYLTLHTGRGTLLVAQLVEALRYKQEGRGFDSRWCHLNFSLT